MAHGQSSDQVRRAGWLAVACGLAACGLTTGCTGPEKEDGLKSLDPATKQKLLGIAPLHGKPGTGNASTDQRFNRTTPVKLPAPELGSTNPPAAGTAPVPAPPVAGPAPLPSVGAVAAPTRPTGNPAVMAPQPAESAWPQPQPPVDPLVRTGGVAPPVADPLRGLPPMGTLPDPSGPQLPVAGGPAMPSGVLPVAPAPGVIPTLQDLPPAGLPTVGGSSAPPVPGQSTLPLPSVPSITDLPPLVK